MAKKEDEIRPIPQKKGEKPARHHSAPPVKGAQAEPKPAGAEVKVGEAKPVSVHVQPTPEEEARRAKMKALDEAMMKFNMYPVAASEEAKDAALAALRKAYSEGDAGLRQAVLYLVHEGMMQFAEYRIPKNMEHFRKRFQQNEPAQNRMNVYRAMFNYSGSLEGIMELADLLAEFGDDDSAKVLTNHFSFLCAYDGSEASRIMRNAVVGALGKSKSLYALKALLAYVKEVENEQLGGRVISSIIEWKEKIDGMKVEHKEKAKLLARINEVVMLEREGGHYR